MFKGVLHAHSVFSDGDESLESVVDLIKQRGMDFVAVSDHAEVFDEPRMRQYVRLCAELSTERFLVIPGLEFAFHGGDIHILGYGITERVRSTAMEELVDGIHAAGGIAVLAHPPAGAINLIGSIKSKLDGIEVWNSRYDGTRTPRAASIQLLRRIRPANMKLAAYGGTDLHKKEQARKPIFVEVDADSLKQQSIMKALAAGQFVIRCEGAAFPSNGRISFIQELVIAMKQPLCRPYAG